MGFVSEQIKSIFSHTIRPIYKGHSNDSNAIVPEVNQFKFLIETLF